MSGLQRVREVYRFWGRHPALYAAQDWIGFVGRPRQIRSAAVDGMGVGSGASVLEVGCGTGRNLPYLERAVGPSGQIVGLDYTPEMLHAAADLVDESGWDNVELVQGDAAAVGLGERSFDGILSVLAMSVIPDYEGALRRCAELLRPGGRLSVGDASLFPGRLRFLNPLVRAVYDFGADWDPDRDLPAAMEKVFGNVSVRTFNAGSMFVATSVAGE